VVALGEARKRIGAHGLFVVGDIAKLPFQSGSFNGLVSLHTIHHLPGDEQKQAFQDLYRTLGRGGKAAVVYSWGDRAPLMRLFQRPMRWTGMISNRFRSGKGKTMQEQGTAVKQETVVKQDPSSGTRPGTYTFKHDYEWILENLYQLNGLKIRVWRSISTQFLRNFIHEVLLGRLWLWILYWVEELVPNLLGRIGQYPLILFDKPEK
jgi:hypothetical protein